ncbi:MAG: sugar transferase, partial [Actinobacteria bacterium]|nr:sugar transferase [Actinomycetota bacterium]
DSPGPVIFRQRRTGRDATPFMMFKFRTMTVNAEATQDRLRGANYRSGPLFKLVRDPRVTRVGRFLRATSLDEIPQLWNVIVGSMSFVGPRPLPLTEAAAVHEHVPQRTLALLGVTGLWQLEARDNPSFKPLQRLDAFYIENRSLALDFSMLAWTVVYVAVRSWRAMWSGDRTITDRSTIILD